MKDLVHWSTRAKAKRDARRDAGICPTCGEDEILSGVSDATGKPYTTCKDCNEQRKIDYQKQKEEKEGSKPTRGVPFPLTITGLHYRVEVSGVIGKIVPCPCDDPIILEFSDVSRDAYHLRNCEITTLPITQPPRDGRRRSDE